MEIIRWGAPKKPYFKNNTARRLIAIHLIMGVLRMMIIIYMLIYVSVYFGFVGALVYVRNVVLWNPQKSLQCQSDPEFKPDNPPSFTLPEDQNKKNIMAEDTIMQYDN